MLQNTPNPHNPHRFHFLSYMFASTIHTIGFEASSQPCPLAIENTCMFATKSLGIMENSGTHSRVYTQYMLDNILDQTEITHANPQSTLTYIKMLLKVSTEQTGW